MRASPAPYSPSWEQLRSNKETPCKLNTERLTNYDKRLRLSVIVPSVMSMGVATVADFLCDMAVIGTAR
jgi:hypothetical protein